MLPLPQSRLSRAFSQISGERVRVETEVALPDLAQEGHGPILGDTEKLNDGSFIIRLAPDKFGNTDKILEVGVHELGHVLSWSADVANNATPQQREANANAIASNLYDSLGLVAYHDESAVSRLEEEGEMRVRQRRAAAFGRGDGTSFESKPTPLKKSLAIKAIGDAGKIGGYALIWGAESQRDLSNEWFSPQTKGLLDIYRAVGNRLPLLYHHGQDRDLKTVAIGLVDSMVGDNIGMWYTAQVNLANQYASHVKRLIAEGRLGTSTQTLAASRDVDKNTGHINRWIIAEVSATPSPSEWRMAGNISVLKAAYDGMGQDFTALLARFGAGDESPIEQAIADSRMVGSENVKFINKMFGRK